METSHAANTTAPAAKSQQFWAQAHAAHEKAEAAFALALVLPYAEQGHALERANHWQERAEAYATRARLQEESEQAVQF